MKNRKGLLIAIGLAGVLISSAAIIRNVSSIHGDEHGSATAQSELYHCPMHPTYTSDRAGDCPICGMKLVKVEQEGSESNAIMHDEPMPDESRGTSKTKHSSCLMHHCPMLHEGRVCPMLILSEDGKPGECPVCKSHLNAETASPVNEPDDIMGYAAVVLSPEKQQMIGIRTSPVVSNEASKFIRTVGRIAYDPELYQAEQEYLEAVKALETARQGGFPEITERAEGLVGSTRTRLELLGLSDDLIQDVKKAGVPDRSLILAKPGGTMWMYAPVYEQELDVVKAGQKVRVTAPNIVPGKIFSGIIRSIDPVLDSQTRSVRVRAVLENKEGLLKQNAYVNAEIEVNLGKQVLIPESAVLDSGERKIAFVALGDGVFEPRKLVLGPKLDDSFVVISGVSEGERVVDQAAFFVDSESRLKAAIGQAAESNQHAGHRM